MKPVFIPFEKIGGFVQGRARVTYLKDQGCFSASVTLGGLDINGIGLNVHHALWDLAKRIDQSNFLKSKLLENEQRKR